MSSASPGSDWIDGTLYPDVPVPARLESLEARIDFVARLCGAWDFGIMPWPCTLREVLRAEWRRAVDEAGMATSCAWHVLRDLHGLPPAPRLGPRFPEIERDPFLDRI